MEPKQEKTKKNQIGFNKEQVINSIRLHANIAIVIPYDNTEAYERSFAIKKFLEHLSSSLLKITCYTVVTDLTRNITSDYDLIVTEFDVKTQIPVICLASKNSRIYVDFNQMKSALVYDGKATHKVALNGFLLSPKIKQIGYTSLLRMVLCAPKDFQEKENQMGYSCAWYGNNQYLIGFDPLNTEINHTSQTVKDWEQYDLYPVIGGEYFIKMFYGIFNYEI